MMKKMLSICLGFSMIFAGAVPTLAGGALEQLDITGLKPSPLPGQVVARLTGIKWDTRSIPVNYSINTTLDPIPNPLGPAFLTVAQARTAMQAAFDAWNDIPTSFIEMRITGETSNPGGRGFDFVNELTFRTRSPFFAIARSPSVSLIEDTVLADGERIDNDADADVSDKITVAADVDGDGDIEFPAGFYKAGTILDNDVSFHTQPMFLPDGTFNPDFGVRFTVDEPDTDPQSFDLMGIAVHEFGHSHGLSHSINNQISNTDGSQDSMYPFIFGRDPISEIDERTPNTDDIAYSSFFYPEGSASSGLGALQPGDVAFNEVFGLITGELRHEDFGGQPVAGGHVFAVDKQTGRLVSGAFSGTTQLSFDLATGRLSLVDPAFNIPDGKFVIPVPKGRYRLGVEAVDGSPIASSSIGTTAVIGDLFGLLNFNEEFPVNDGNDDSDAGAIRVDPGQTRGNNNIVVHRDLSIENFGSLNFVGFGSAGPGLIYAVRIPAAQIDELSQHQDFLIKAADFCTAGGDPSVVATFAEALVTTGVVNPDDTASVDLDRPLAREKLFVGQEFDFTPLFIKNPRATGKKVRRGIDSGEIENLFLVLRVPTTTPFPGPNGLTPFVCLDGNVTPDGLPNDVPIFGLSYISEDGGATFTRIDKRTFNGFNVSFNFMFSLRLAKASRTNDGD